jgi:hypothetical protein
MAIHIRRRDFITLLAGGACEVPGLIEQRLFALARAIQQSLE